MFDPQGTNDLLLQVHSKGKEIFCFLIYSTRIKNISTIEFPSTTSRLLSITRSSSILYTVPDFRENFRLPDKVLTISFLKVESLKNSREESSCRSGHTNDPALPLED